MRMIIALLLLFANASDLSAQLEESKAQLEEMLIAYDTLQEPEERFKQAFKIADKANLLTNFPLAIRFADTLMHYALLLESDLYLGQAYLVKFMFNDNMGEGETTEYGEKAVQYFIRAENFGGAVNICCQIAYYQARDGHCDLAVHYLNKVDSLMAAYEVPLNTKVIAGIRQGDILMTCDRMKPALEAAQKNLPASMKLGNPNFVFASYNQLMVANALLGEIDSAFAYLKLHEAVLTESDRLKNHANFYNNAGIVYIEAKRFDEAYTFFKQALAFKREHLNYEQQAKTLIELGKLCILHLKRNKEGIDYLEEALPHFLENDDKIGIEEIYQSLARANNRLGNYTQADQYLQYSDSIRNYLKETEYESRLDKLLVQYETEKVNRELTESKLALLEAERIATKNKRIVYLLLALLTFSVFLFLYLRSRRRRKQLEHDKRQAELRYNLLRAQMNPHFIFNSLNSIQSFFSNQRFGQGNEFLGTFSQLVRRVLEQTGQKAISLSEELETLTMYLELEQLRLGNRLDFNIHLDPEVETDLIRVPPLIFQPFVENAIWHGIAPKNGPGQIDIHIDYNDAEDALLCRIEDDGIGMTNKTDREISHRSRGVEITRERLGKGGRIHIHDRTDTSHTGVRTDLIIPLWE